MMTLSDNKLDELIKEAVDAYTLSGTKWSIEGFDRINKIELVIDILLGNTQFVNEFEKHGYSRKYLRNLIHSKTFPDMKVKGIVSGKVFRKSLSNFLLKSPKSQKSTFIFPVNVNPPDTLFQKKFRICNYDVIWFSRNSFFNCKYYNNSMNKKYEELYSKKDYFYRESFVTVKIECVEEQFGADKAHEVLKIFLGVINLSLLCHVSKTSWSINQIRTISDITGSPYYFKNDKSGLSEGYWISEDFITTKYKNLNKRDFEKFEKLYVLIKKLNKRYDLYLDVHKYLILYQEAVSAPDEFSSFMKLWACLELLTFIEIGDTYDELLKRLKGIYDKNNPVLFERIDLIRIKRNQLAHKVKGVVYQEDLSFIRKISEDLFMFIMESVMELKSKEKILMWYEHSLEDKNRLRDERAIISKLIKR